MGRALQRRCSLHSVRVMFWARWPRLCLMCRLLLRFRPPQEFPAVSGLGRRIQIRGDPEGRQPSVGVGKARRFALMDGVAAAERDVPPLCD